MALNIVITNAGRNALVDAQNTGTNHVTVAQIGVSSTAVTAAFTSTALDGELKRLDTVSGVAVAHDIIHVTVQDTSTDSYDVRSFALYLDDGTLFAIYGQADPIIEKSTAAILLLAADIAVSDIDAASVTFGATDFTIPPATTTTMGVVQLADDAEATAGTDPNLVVTCAALLAAFVTWLATYGVWRASNDGAGSGLDADLLDGQEGAYYSDVPARLGYTPLNETAYTAADVMAKVQTLDGAGSGLDADLLDGQEGAWYANIPARLGYTPLDQAAYTAADVMAKVQTLDGAGSGLDADLLDGQEGAWYTNIPARLGYTPLNQTAYTAADVMAKVQTLDGAGSGLDADLLDGHDSSHFTDLTNATVGVVSNANGVAITIGNLIIQVGQKNTVAADTTAEVDYPLALTTNAPFWAIAGQRTTTFDANGDAYGQVIGTPGLTSMTVANNQVNNHPTIDIPWAIMAFK